MATTQNNHEKAYASFLRDQGFSNRSIAAALNRNHNTIGAWLNPLVKEYRRAYHRGRSKRIHSAVGGSDERCRIVRCLGVARHQAKANGHAPVNATAEEVMRAHERQEACCAICGRHESELSRRLMMDHDHATGKFRGLLCDRCNKLVGVFEKYESSIRAYLGRQEA